MGEPALLLVVVVVTTLVTTSSPARKSVSRISSVSSGIAWTYATEGARGSWRKIFGSRMLLTDAAGDAGAEAIDAGRGMEDGKTGMGAMMLGAFMAGTAAAGADGTLTLTTMSGW